MAHEPDRRDPDDTPRKPPILVRMADAGNMTGRLSTAALVFIVVVAAIGLVAVYFAFR
jgi:hypothetical protein